MVNVTTSIADPSHFYVIKRRLTQVPHEMKTVSVVEI